VPPRTGEAAPARRGLFPLLGPGILVAATGVGAGDLATASFAGSQLGVAILWAAALGAFLKYVLNEGLARWQLATGDTLLEGAVRRFGAVVGWMFLPYLALWSFFVGAALMSACGVALQALLPLFDDAEQGRVIYGVLSSVAGLMLVRAGGFRLFERVMSACIALMFVTVVLMALLLWPGTGEVLRGLFLPRIPQAGGEGVVWTVAMMGGVGGTLTMLCYGYWIREEGREGIRDLSLCRLDLGLGYAMTALFAMAMVVIGSRVEVDGRGTGLLLELADTLQSELGAAGRWAFLLGVLGAVLSSLLGVWQAAPYLFADLWAMTRRGSSAGVPRGAVDVRAAPYRLYLWLIATVPMLGLVISFKEIQKLYATLGATFVPLLALALLVMNGRRAWVGEHTNRWPTVIVLIATLAFFAVLGWLRIGE